MKKTNYFAFLFILFAIHNSKALLKATEFRLINQDTEGQVRVALTGQPNQLSISWQATSTLTATLYYGYSESQISTRVTGTVSSYSACTGSYRSIKKEVVLSNLLPNSKIFYKYVKSDGQSLSKTFSVNTPRNVGERWSFTMIAGGDTDHKQNNAALVQQQILRNEKYELFFHAGDFAYDSPTDQKRWDEFGKFYEPLQSSTFYQFCVGNHEKYCDDKFENYKNRYSHLIARNSNSKQMFWHSFEYSYVHFVSFSSEHTFTRDSEQYTWFENDLKKVDRSKTPWLIVVLHQPMYASNMHGSNVKLRDSLEPLFEKYNVDVVLAGHEHAYERTCLVWKEKCFNQTSSTEKRYKGTLHMTIGTLGRPPRTNWRSKPTWSLVREATNGYARIHISKTQFNLKFILIGGKVFDEISLTK